MKKNILFAASLAVAGMLIVGCSKSHTESTSSDELSSLDGEEVSISESEEVEESTIESPFSEESSDVSSSRQSADSEDWDEVLKSYEKFSDKYIALLNKIKKGDVSALADYTEYMTEAQTFIDKMQSASGELSAAQMEKFNKIQQKITKVASSVSIDQSKIKSAQKKLESLGASFLGGDDDDQDD